MTSHIAISVPDPERAAKIIADLWRGEAMQLPPHDAWVAYADDEQDSAVDIYPLRSRPRAGQRSERSYARRRAKAPHIVVASPLTRAQIEAIARRENALPRIADRGPFVCLDFWIEDWLHIEVVAFAMRVDHARNPEETRLHDLPRAAAERRR